MRILIDADGCPVVDIAIRTAQKHGLEAVIFCDFAHVYDRAGARTVTTSVGADSVDFALVNQVKQGDIVVTQDYGLAAMCLARRAIAVNQNGQVYTDENISGLLHVRHISQKARRAGGRVKGSPKRTAEQNAAFERAIEALIAEHGGGAKPQ